MSRPSGSSAGGTSDVLVVFGITGDLAHKMTFPALYRLEVRGQLDCRIIGVAMDALGPDEIRARARAAVEEKEPSVDEGAFGRLAARLDYVAGRFDEPDLYERVKSAVGDARTPVYYLEIPPGLFGRVIRALGAAGLTGNARVVIEKPFGTDLASARALNAEIHEVLDESRIYRIDHFLGKEPVQDIVYLRFANEFLEPVWNRDHVESVQITLAENFDVADRGAFYDRVGALRDVVQNHLMQVLGLVAMEPPLTDPGSIPDRRLDVFRAMPAADPDLYVRGQYQGYRETEGVARDSDTETFAALRLSVANWRWDGVPFFIRTGKALKTSATRVDLRLRRPPDILAGARGGEIRHHNQITLRLGADAGVSLRFLVKRPQERAAQPVHLDASFAEQIGELADAYERLLLDAMRGDQTLFPREAVIEETWRIVQPLLEHPAPVERYDKGSWGPEGAATLAKSVGGWMG